MTVTASNFERKENDLYETEAWATEALLRSLPYKPQIVWEPSAGNHAIADVLRDHGIKVVTSDIVTYDREHDFLFDFLVGDFTKLERFGFDAIITNPPYGRGNRDAVQYARRIEFLQSLFDSDLFGWSLLLTAKFDFGKTRQDLFADNLYFHSKTALVDRISWAGNGQTGTEDHAWYNWNIGTNAAPYIQYEGKAA